MSAQADRAALAGADRPPDVLHGCPACGGAWLFIHGTFRQRECDRCGGVWDAEELGEAIGRLLSGV